MFRSSYSDSNTGDMTSDHVDIDPLGLTLTDNCANCAIALTNLKHPGRDFLSEVVIEPGSVTITLVDILIDTFGSSVAPLLLEQSSELKLCHNCAFTIEQCYRFKLKFTQDASEAGILQPLNINNSNNVSIKTEYEETEGSNSKGSPQFRSRNSTTFDTHHPVFYANSQIETSDSQSHQDEYKPTFAFQSVQHPIRRGPGRPRKYPIGNAVSTSTSTVSTGNEPRAKRGRGRPRTHSTGDRITKAETVFNNAIQCSSSLSSPMTLVSRRYGRPGPGRPRKYPEVNDDIKKNVTNNFPMGHLDLDPLSEASARNTDEVIVTRRGPGRPPKYKGIANGRPFTRPNGPNFQFLVKRGPGRPPKNVSYYSGTMGLPDDVGTEMTTDVLTVKRSPIQSWNISDLPETDDQKREDIVTGPMDFDMPRPRPMNTQNVYLDTETGEIPMLDMDTEDAEADSSGLTTLTSSSAATPPDSSASDEND